MSCVVGPSGIFSTARYHFLSWLGQKYGCVKTSWKHSTCTPCFPAASISGRCASTILSRICWGDMSVVPLSPIWISPAFNIVMLTFSSRFLGAARYLDFFLLACPPGKKEGECSRLIRGAAIKRHSRYSRYSRHSRLFYF